MRRISLALRRLLLDKRQTVRDRLTSTRMKGGSLGIEKTIELHPGDNFVEKIRQAVLDSDTVVSVIGGHQPSPNVLVEMGMALAQGKRVLPIVLDADADISTLAEFAQLQSIRTHDAEQAAEAIASLTSQESGDSV